MSSYNTLYQNPFPIKKKCVLKTHCHAVFPKALVLLDLLVSRRAPGSHKTQQQGNTNLVCSEWVLHLIVNRRLQPRQGFQSTVVCITMNSIARWQPYYQRHSEARPIKGPFNQCIIPERRGTQMCLINNNLPEKKKPSRYGLKSNNHWGLGMCLKKKKIGLSFPMPFCLKCNKGAKAVFWYKFTKPHATIPHSSPKDGQWRLGHNLQWCRPRSLNSTMKTTTAAIKRLSTYCRIGPSSINHEGQKSRWAQVHRVLETQRHTGAEENLWVFGSEQESEEGKP